MTCLAMRRHTAPGNQHVTEYVGTRYTDYMGSCHAFCVDQSRHRTRILASDREVAVEIAGVVSGRVPNKARRAAAINKLLKKRLCIYYALIHQSTFSSFSN